MTKIKLRYIGGHQPQGIVEVDSKKVEGLLKIGAYLRLDEQIYNKEEFTKKKKLKEEIKEEI